MVKDVDKKEDQIITHYNPDLFTNRVKEIGEITATIKQVVEQSDVSQLSRIKLVLQERGFGKTWLLIHLHRCILEKRCLDESITQYLTPLWIGFDSNYDSNIGPLLENEYRYTKSITDLLEWIAGRLQLPNKDAASDSVLTQRIINVIESELFGDSDVPKHSSNRQKTLVLFIDSVFEGGQRGEGSLDQIERSLLAPLAMLKNVVIVMTGRGHQYIWSSPELREAELIQPESFSKYHVREQLAKAAEQAASQVIWQISDGIPLLTRLCAWSMNAQDPAEQSRRWHLTLEEVFTAFPILHAEKGIYRDIVRVLSLLPKKARFLEEEIQFLLVELQYTEDELLPKQIRAWISTLLDDRVVQYEGGGYRLDQTIRLAQRAVLDQTDRELYNCLYGAVSNMYEHFMDEYPNDKSLYEPLLAEHNSKNDQKEGVQ